jgi:hypothetical protein
MEMAVHSWVRTLKDTWNLGTQMSNLSVKKKLNSVFGPVVLRSETSRTSESCIDENVYCLFTVFIHPALHTSLQVFVYLCFRVFIFYLLGLHFVPLIRAT